MLVKGITGRYSPDKMLPDYEVFPDSEIISGRGACECGWQGEMWERVTTPEAADFSCRQDYVAPHEFANASGGAVEDAIHDEWKAHIAPSEAVLGVEAAAREYNQAGHRLDKTAAAKAAGASWADIGRAVGISRQSTHERWNDK